MPLSKSQINKLGERLRSGEHADDDLRLLNDFRTSFADVIDQVTERIEERLSIEVTARRAKSIPSIIDKLQRIRTIDLTRMQDIAGCRLVVGNVIEQDRIVQKLSGVFDDPKIKDRRLKPSHGYRAVHLIVKHESKLVEIQIRTRLQHGWAEVCERFADIKDPTIKYGGGPLPIIRTLQTWAETVAEIERVEKEVMSTSDEEMDKERFLRLMDVKGDELRLQEKVLTILDTMG